MNLIKLNQDSIKTRTLITTALMLTLIGTSQASDRYANDPSASGAVQAEQAEADAQSLASAMVNNTTLALCFSGSSLDAQNVGQVGVFGPAPIQGFPISGDDFAVLTTGNAANVPGTFGNFTSVNNGFPDEATLTLDFALGSVPGELTFDYKYGTEENPTYTVSGFQDPFTVSLNPGGTIIAEMTVLDASAISNTPGGTSAVPLPPGPSPDDTSYNAVTTNVQNVSHGLAGFANSTVSISFSITDAQDQVLDSGVFLDNLSIDGCEDVGIDIKPGSFPNSINLDSGGTVPIAILGSDVLDVSNIDPSSVTMADAKVKIVGKADKTKCSIEDVSGDFSVSLEGMPDGYPDLVCHMETTDLDADCSTTSADVSFDYNGITIAGSDSVSIVKDGQSCQP